MLILDLWGISFHAVAVFGLGKNLLFKSILGRCVAIILSFDNLVNKCKNLNRKTRHFTVHLVRQSSVVAQRGQIFCEETFFHEMYFILLLQKEFQPIVGSLVWSKRSKTSWELAFIPLCPLRQFVN